MNGIRIATLVFSIIATTALSVGLIGKGLPFYAFAAFCLGVGLVLSISELIAKAK